MGSRRRRSPANRPVRTGTKRSWGTQRGLPENNRATWWSWLSTVRTSAARLLEKLWTSVTPREQVGRGNWEGGWRKRRVQGSARLTSAAGTRKGAHRRDRIGCTARRNHRRGRGGTGCGSDHAENLCAKGLQQKHETWNDGREFPATLTPVGNTRSTGMRRVKLRWRWDWLGTRRRGQIGRSPQETAGPHHAERQTEGQPERQRSSLGRRGRRSCPTAEAEP